MYGMRMYRKKKKKKKKHEQYGGIYTKWYYVLGGRSPQYSSKDRTIAI